MSLTGQPVEEYPQAAIQEQYAASLARLRAMGHLIVSGQVELLESEIGPEVQAFADFSSSVREMIKTDEEFRDSLDIDDKREHAVIDGMARDTDGNSLVELIDGGKIVSEAIAKVNPIFEAQAVRDDVQLKVAEIADALEPGEAYIGLSVEPKEELKKYKEEYTGLGYRDGLTYVQWYVKAEHDKIVAGSFSVDMSDETAWREILAEEGVTIPPGESPNTWLLHGIRKHNVSPEQIESYVKELRDRYYEHIGATGERKSVSEFVENNEEMTRAIFDQYYPSLAEAVYTGDNNQTMQGLAQAMMNIDLTKMKSDIRSQLVRISTSERFDDKLARTMESIIRYAAVELLRKDLPSFIAGEPIEVTNVYQANQLNVARIEPIVVVSPQLLANSVGAGLSAGRTYGGCAGQVQLGNDETSSGGGGGAPGGSASPQEAYAGKGSFTERVGKLRIDKCAVPKCPTRPNKVLVGGCGVCIGRCQARFDKGEDPTKD